MTSALKRRTVYIGTVIAIFAMVGGFALASSNVLLAHHTQNASGDNVATSGTVNGVTYVADTLNITDSAAVATSPNALLGAPGSPVALVSNINVFCMSAGTAAFGSGASACVMGDFAEVVNYSFTSAFSGAMEISMFMGASATSGIQSLFVKQASPSAVGGNILLYWDLGTAGQTLNSITVTLYQCQGAGATCP